MPSAQHHPKPQSLTPSDRPLGLSWFSETFGGSPYYGNSDADYVGRGSRSYGLGAEEFAGLLPSHLYMFYTARTITRTETIDVPMSNSRPDIYGKPRPGQDLGRIIRDRVVCHEAAPPPDTAANNQLGSPKVVISADAAREAARGGFQGLYWLDADGRVVDSAALAAKLLEVIKTRLIQEGYSTEQIEKLFLQVTSLNDLRGKVGSTNPGVVILVVHGMYGSEGYVYGFWIDGNPYNNYQGEGGAEQRVKDAGGKEAVERNPDLLLDFPDHMGELKTEMDEAGRTFIVIQCDNSGYVDAEKIIETIKQVVPKEGGK